ncbi:hypothetical protein AB1K89_07050 [Sporosarcina sp. 179-K 8C2 HS]|uniref:hypothetical protein n=1 Tax=Sporosarcina sp. 179-K 8C2 HS TaxID=3142387 RepID=UPI0039A2CE23
MSVHKVIFKKKVAKDRLVHHIEKEKITCSKNNIEEMYVALLEKDKTLVQELFDEYQYAGKTSVNIFEIAGFPQKLNNKRNFLSHIQKKLGVTNILNRKLLPSISEVPQINLVEEIKNGIRIQWVHGINVENTDGYKVISRIDLRFVTTIITFGSPVFVEVRAGYKNSVTYINLLRFLISNDESPVDLTRIPLTKVTEREAEEIADILEAGLLEGEHLGSNGIGKYAISADPDTKDLRDLDEYKKGYMGKKYLAQTLNVFYEDAESGYKTNVKFRINMNGGFEFKSKVSEKIIKRIFDVFAEVRYKQVSSEKVSNE